MGLGRRTALKAGAGALVMAPAMVRAQAAMKLPLATVWPDANFHVINCRRFADEVKKATGGAIEIDVKSGGQLGFKGPECLRAVRDGLVPIADYLNTQQIGDEPFMGIEGVPVPRRLARGAADPAQAHPSGIREDRGQEQSDDPLCRAVAEPIPPSQGEGGDGRRAQGHQDPHRRQGRAGHLGLRRHGADRDAVGRAAARPVVGRGVRRVDLGRVGRRRQVLGVPQVLPCDQPAMVVGHRGDQQ